MQGTGRSDVFAPGAGNNQVVGGIGVDTATFDGSRASYTMSYSKGSIVVTENATGAINTLTGVEYVRFADGMYLNQPVMAQVDFDGDGRSEILLSDLASGIVSTWSVNGTMFGIGRSIATAPAN